MNKISKVTCKIFFLLCFLLGSGTNAFAYSYGDPNKEEAAEIYEQMVASLSKEPAQYKEAQAAFDAIKEELEMHMGNKPVTFVQSALDEKRSADVITLMQKVLVLNVARRLESVDINDYTNAKLLIAKANATYNALSPEIMKTDQQLHEKLRNDFDKTLQSIGNPGLFGVGKKEPDPSVFETAKSDILTSLQTFFKMKSLEVGHFTDASPSNETAQPGGNIPQDQSFNSIIIGAGLLIVVILLFIVVRKRKK